jgi:hypothetical protein
MIDVGVVSHTGVAREMAAVGKDGVVGFVSDVVVAMMMRLCDCRVANRE